MIPIQSVGLGAQIQGFNLESHSLQIHEVIQLQKLETGCVVNLQLGGEKLCVSPDQLFYDFEKKDWTPAKNITVETKLITKGGHIVQCDLVVVKEDKNPAVVVCRLNLSEPHTFFVGKHQILAHNFSPAIPIGITLTWKFGGVATVATVQFAGATLSFFGLGKLAYDYKNKKASIKPDARGIVNALNAIPPTDPKKPDDDEENEDSKKKERWRANREEKPREPTKDDDFGAPKRWNRQKQTDRFGNKGWIDNKGRCWKPDGHGGFHWDVQLHDGTHLNVCPGGWIRGEPGVRLSDIVSVKFF
jgi:hypothetical protein